MKRRAILRSLLPAAIAITVAPLIQATEPEPMSRYKLTSITPRLLLERGLITPEQYLRPYFPDLSDEELTEMLNHEIMGPIRGLVANTTGVYVDFQPSCFKLIGRQIRQHGYDEMPGSDEIDFTDEGSGGTNGR